jgi:radical SAM protein with 4Fe4S-binding SPASM domain
LECSHCYAAKFSKAELNTTEKFLLVKDALQTGIKRISLTGGEVLLQKDSLKLIDYISELGVSVSVFTNGTTLSEEIVRQLAKKQVFVLVSIDGASKESHESLRGAGTWELTMAGTKRLREFGVPFATVMSLHNQNYNEVRAYLSLARDLGATRGCLIPVMLTGRARKEMILGPVQVVQTLKAVENAAENLNFPASLWCTPFGKLLVKSKYVSTSYCRLSDEDLEIDPEGNVLLCDITNVQFSNVREKGILEAWKEQEAAPLVKSLTYPELPEPCSSCELKQQCRGGCFARAEVMLNDITAPDPLCPRVAGLI